MFRRFFWLVTGAGFGFGASLWVARAVRLTADRFRPQRVGTDLGSAILQLGRDVRAAAGEGLAAMREEEAVIRREIGDPGRRRAGPAIPVGEVERPDRPDRRDPLDDRDGGRRGAGRGAPPDRRRR